MTHRGNTINDGTDRRAVGFTVGGDTEDATESRHYSVELIGYKVVEKKMQSRQQACD